MLDESFIKDIEKGDYLSLLGRSPLVPFNLFWKKSNGKKVLIKSMGDFSSRSEIEKWTKRKITLETETILSEEWINEGVRRLVQFEFLFSQDFLNQIEINNWRTDFVNWLHPSLWEQSQELSQFDICFLMGTFFCDLSEEEEDWFLNFPIELQKKNYLMASFGTLIAIIIGYTDPTFLKDYFKVLVFWDCPFTQTMWSEREKSFLIQEWNEPGLGLALSSDTEKKIRDLYSDGVIKTKELLKNRMAHPNLLKYLEWSFESVGGEGRPFGFKGNELSDLDILTIFISHRFSFEDELSREKQHGLIKDLFEVSSEFKKIKLNRRLEIILSTSFNKAIELKGGFLEIVGL